MHVPAIPGRRRADIVFSRAHVVVYVDGCYWHSCPDHATVPKSNREWWVAKLQANMKRDRETDAQLRGAGWEVVRIWEHEVAAEAADRVEATLRRRAEPRSTKVR